MNGGGNQFKLDDFRIGCSNQHQSMSANSIALCPREDVVVQIALFRDPHGATAHSDDRILRPPKLE